MHRRSFHYLTSLGLASTFKRFSWSDHDITKPERLKNGDKIGLIAPGSSIPSDRVEQAIETSKSLDLVPVLGDFVYESNGYLAGTDIQRLADLHRMFEDPGIKAIWCIRGGYGCTRLLPKINYSMIRKNPKILLGYSDITALHLAINHECNLVTFHGPVASSTPTEYTIHALEAVIFNNEPVSIEMANRSADNNKEEIYTIRRGSAEGILTGGNLSLLAALVGTRWCPSYAGKIVFIEDIGEKPYRIDRMLVQLFQGTDLAQASGIILGRFMDCEGKPGEKTFSLKETLHYQFSKLDTPVFYGFSFGHIDNNCTFPLGIKARFSTDDKILHLQEACTLE